MKKKTYQVIWEEKLKVSVEAKNEHEALEMVSNGEYENSEVMGELSTMPEVYLIND